MIGELDAQFGLDPRFLDSGLAGDNLRIDGNSLVLPGCGIGRYRHDAGRRAIFALLLNGYRIDPQALDSQ
jgi:hypothetical protein